MENLGRNFMTKYYVIDLSYNNREDIVLNTTAYSIKQVAQAEANRLNKNLFDYWFEIRGRYSSASLSEVAIKELENQLRENLHNYEGCATVRELELV